MKSNTIVHIGCRNVGDSSDNGEFFEGPLKDGILWLVSVLGSKSMATRFAIGIGRNKLGAEQGIQVGPRAGRLEMSELGGALDALLAGDSPDDVLASVAEGATSVDPRDTWQGAAS